MKQPRLSADEQRHLQDFMTVLLKVFLFLTPLLLVMRVVEYLRRPVWTSLLTAAFIPLGVVIWGWCLRRVRAGEIRRPARVIVAVFLLMLLLYMLFVAEPFRARQSIGFALIILMATALDEPRMALWWAAIAGACYAAGLVLPRVLPLPTVDASMGSTAGSFFAFVQMGCIAAIGRSMTHHLRQALARSESVRQDLERQKAELEGVKTALTTLASDLERSNRELEKFAYVVSHDLRAPLRALNNYSRFLQEDTAGTLAPESVEHLQGINESARHMNALVEGLLQYSRIGRHRMEVETVDVSALLDRIVTTLQLRERADVTLPAPPVVLQGYAVRIDQILTNLIDNAVKFSRPGVRPAVSVECVDRNDAWELTVRDNGIGIEPKHFEKIFGIFQRLHAQDTYEGTGIGLAIVKKAVEEHGGKIWVESSPGQGSAFHFTLPKAIRH